MDNNVTELVFIIDKSGSMVGKELDTIGSFNSLINKQTKIDGKAFVTTILFSDSIKMLHDRFDLREIKPMTTEQYSVGGCTALLDAIGNTINHIRSIHKYARKEDIPNQTLFFITTDGKENASRNFSSNKVKEMIKRQEEEYGWKFYFIAANIDAVETAERIGIRRERAAEYEYNSAGVQATYNCMNKIVCNARQSPSNNSEESELSALLSSYYKTENQN